MTNVAKERSEISRSSAVSQFACHLEQMFVVQRGIWARRFAPVRERRATFGKLRHYRSSGFGMHLLSDPQRVAER